jgi:nitroreductase
MEFMDVVATRKSVRSYAKREVEEEKLTRILEAARMAPSWANKQCVNYIVIKNREKIEQLAGTFNSWIKQAPVVVAACADPYESGSHDHMDYYLVDVGISMQQLILAATNQGLGTCWVGAFNETKVKKVLGVPEKIKVVALTPIGYPSNESAGTKLIKKFIGSEKRQPIERILHMNKW